MLAGAGVLYFAFLALGLALLGVVYAGERVRWDRWPRGLRDAVVFGVGLALVVVVATGWELLAG